MDILTLFCKTDDFFLMYEAYLTSRSIQDDKPTETRGRRRGLHASEVMTILIAFHQSKYRTLKHFYEKHVCVYWRAAFPNLVSYSRLVQLQQEVFEVLTLYLYAHFSTCSGISFVDSTACGSVITGVSQPIASSQHTPGAGKLLWGGSMA